MPTVMRVNALEFMNASIGKNLRRLREEAGLSQSEVARRAKMRAEIVCRVERGKGNPTVGTVQRIVAAIQKE